MPREALVRRVADVHGERDAFLKTLRLESLPAPARESVESEFGAQFDQLEAERVAGAEVWAFRYDKCPRCGWFREGYVAVRDCKIVYELETLDTM